MINQKESISDFIKEDGSYDNDNKNTIYNINNLQMNNKKQSPKLDKMFVSDYNIIEVGIDEAGRGPMLGRVYSAATVLPKDDSFLHLSMKDSKKFTSKKKIESVSDYIKENAIAWSINYVDEKTIDDINILQATQMVMHKSIENVIEQLIEKFNYNTKNILLLIDGNYFIPFEFLHKDTKKKELIKYEMIKGGDNKYTSIAAASILAKVARDKYISELCEENPELIERYSINTNKGYGSKKHMDGILKYGISKWHRKTFGICKNYN